MHKIEKSAIVLHQKTTMFSLVDRVEDYPKFLPWCGKTEILYRDKNKTTASIEINFKGIKQTFTTENQKINEDVMKIKLVDGPFKYLSGEWAFKELDKDSCQIQLKLEYQFSNIILEKLIAPVFNIIANTFIDEFIKQANKINNDR
jgi:ribosome-associated toxin RatA of RatAB toxin-antitoxin module